MDDVTTAMFIIYTAYGLTSVALRTNKDTSVGVSKAVTAQHFNCDEAVNHSPLPGLVEFVFVTECLNTAAKIQK